MAGWQCQNWWHSIIKLFKMEESGSEPEPEGESEVGNTSSTRTRRRASCLLAACPGRPRRTRSSDTSPGLGKSLIASSWRMQRREDRGDSALWPSVTRTILTASSRAALTTLMDGQSIPSLVTLEACKNRRKTSTGLKCSWAAYLQASQRQTWEPILIGTVGWPRLW